MCDGLCDGISSGVGEELKAPSASNPPSISAEELDRLLRLTFRIGNQVKLRFIKALRALDKTELYLKLKCSSTAQYAEKRFGYGHSETYAMLEAAEQLESLPLLEAVFEAGELRWSHVKQILRIASSETVAEWIEFARKKTVRQLKAEVDDARKKGRKNPRKDRYGLPALNVRMVFELKPDEHEILERALKKAAQEMEARLKGAKVKPHEALLFLAEQSLKADGQGSEEGEEGGGKDDSLYTILYRVCPSCRDSQVHTKDGFVDVPKEAIERIEGDARKVSIVPEEEVPQGPLLIEVGSEPDRPTPPAMRRRVFLRDGGVCVNPSCRATRNLHSHHLIYRSERGRTEIWNLTSLCDRCHSMAHLGYLKIKGNPADGFTFEPGVGREELDFAKARGGARAGPSRACGFRTCGIYTQHLDGDGRQAGEERGVSGE